MLHIRCPWCGLRDENEFVCGGASHLVRPPLEAGDEAWGDYLFFRDNPRGPHRERWRHVHGCGQWFNVSRHTVTHEILAVYAMTDPAPPDPAPPEPARADLAPADPARAEPAPENPAGAEPARAEPAPAEPAPAVEVKQ